MINFKLQSLYGVCCSGYDLFMSDSKWSPELTSIAKQMCQNQKGDIAVMAKQRAVRQVQSYMHVLRLRLQKDECSAETLIAENDSMLFVQNLLRFQ